MYRWLVFIHILGVAGFLLSHGVSTTVLLKLRKERDRKKISALLELSGSTINLFYVSFVLLLVGGIWGGFLGHWWSQKWIWASLIIFVLVSILMYFLATRLFIKLRHGVQVRPSGNPNASDAELEHLLGSNRVTWVAVTGFGGLAFILYLMVVKPF